MMIIDRDNLLFISIKIYIDTYSKLSQYTQVFYWSFIGLIHLMYIIKTKLKEWERVGWSKL